jgi:hypothetical protein
MRVIVLERDEQGWRFIMSFTSLTTPRSARVSKPHA